MKARDIINILEKKFPKINAEEWDNVGLLIGDYDKKVKKIPGRRWSTPGAPPGTKNTPRCAASRGQWINSRLSVCLD